MKEDDYLNDADSRKIHEKGKAIEDWKPQDAGLLRSQEFHDLIKRQTDLSISISDRQHKDVQYLSRYSRRLDKFTALLIVLTAFLGGVTVFTSLHTDSAISQLKDLTQEAFLTENFHTSVTYLGSVPITLEQQNYSNANFVNYIRFSTISPHYLKFTVLGMSLDPINSCDFPKFQKVNLVQPPLVIYRDKGVDNSDIQIPFTLDFTAFGVKPSHTTINSNNISILTELRTHVIIADYQTGEVISPNSIIQTDILIHRTYANFCHD